MSMKPRTFAKSSVTYGEMIEVLEQLGYRPEFDGKYNRYTNKEHNSIVLIPVCSPEELVEKVYLENDSYVLYMKGVIEAENGIVRLIEKNRLKKNKKNQKAEQTVA